MNQKVKKKKKSKTEINVKLIKNIKNENQLKMWIKKAHKKKKKI